MYNEIIRLVKGWYIAMAKYVGLSACEANAMAGREVYTMQQHEVVKESILRHQKEKTWEMPENTYERHMFETWLDDPDTWRYGFGLSYRDKVCKMTREERIQIVTNYKEEV